MNNNQYTIDDLLVGNPVFIAMEEPVPSFPSAGAGSGGSDTIVADLISQRDILLDGEGVSLAGSVFTPDISNEAITHDIVFSSPSAVRAAWSSGTITTSGGLTYSILAGDTTARLTALSKTSPMNANVIIYFDITTPTLLQVTYTPSETVGSGKTILATAKPGAASAILQVTSGIGGLVIDEDVMFVSNLAAINADMGAITAGTITLDSSGYIRGGQSSFDSGSGFFLGYSGGNYKFSLGSVSKSMTWDGSNLEIDGGELTSGTITGALIRTSSSGSRVQLNDSTNTLQIFDSSGNVRAESYANGWEFSTESEVTAGRIFIESTFNNLQIQAVSSNLLLTAIGDVLFAPDNGSIQGYFDSRGLHLNDDLDMNGNDIDMEGGEIDACGDITMDGYNNDIENVDRIEGLAGYIDFGFSSYFSVENDFLPQSDDSYDLGSSSTAWQDTYTHDLYYDSLKSLSDRRLKKNIVSVKTGLASILSLNPISFNYKEKDTELKPDRKEKKNKGKNMKDFPERQAKFLEKRKARSEKLHYGFIAQEVQEVLPELVQKNKDNDMLNLNTTEVIPFLVKAVQELSAEVEALKK